MAIKMTCYLNTGRKVEAASRHEWHGNFGLAGPVLPTCCCSRRQLTWRQAVSMSAVSLGVCGNPSPRVPLPPAGPWLLLELVLGRQLQLSQLQGCQGETVLGAGGGSLVLSPGLRAVKTKDADSKRLRPQSRGG